MPQRSYSEWSGLPDIKALLAIEGIVCRCAFRSEFSDVKGNPNKAMGLLVRRVLDHVKEVIRRQSIEGMRAPTQEMMGQFVGIKKARLNNILNGGATKNDDVGTFETLLRYLLLGKDKQLSDTQCNDVAERIVAYFFPGNSDKIPPFVRPKRLALDVPYNNRELADEIRWALHQHARCQIYEELRSSATKISVISQRAEIPFGAKGNVRSALQSCVDAGVKVQFFCADETPAHIAARDFVNGTKKNAAVLQSISSEGEIDDSLNETTVGVLIETQFFDYTPSTARSNQILYIVDRPDDDRQDDESVSSGRPYARRKKGSLDKVLAFVSG